MADAIVAAGSDAQAAAEAAQVQVATPKKQKAAAKTLEDGFVIPEGAVQVESHEAYRVDF